MEIELFYNGGTMEQRDISTINHYMIDSLNPRVAI